MKTSDIPFLPLPIVEVEVKLSSSMQLFDATVVHVKCQHWSVTLSRLIDRMKTEFHFKFAALALQFNWKMQLIMFLVSIDTAQKAMCNQNSFP